MTGAEKQILKIVKQLKNADEEKIAAAMCVSKGYVHNLCSALMQEGFLTQLGGEYRLASKGSKLVPSVPQSRVVNIDKKRGEIGGDGSRQSEQKYREGEIIGEIKMKHDLPPREEVETGLKKNPWFSYEQIEAQMRSHTLVCPAKGKEVTWHYCSYCPHQDGIDFQRWTVQCKYEFTERKLDMIFGQEELKALSGRSEGQVTDLDKEEAHVNLPHVVCPISDKLVAVDHCTDCRYERTGEWEAQSKKKGVVGWVLCGAPHSFEVVRDQEARKVVHGEKEMLMVPPRWE